MIKKEETILVVEDSQVNRELLVYILNKQKYHVLQADSGQAALEIIKENTPDLILLDIVMPGMDGYALCSRLKQNARTQDVPVIFISALDSTDSKLTGFELGCADYITKPFQPEEVLVRCATQLKISHIQHQLEEQNKQLEREKRKSEALLFDVFPSRVARDLMAHGTSPTQFFKEVSVCFVDIVGFTGIVSRLDPEFVIRELNDIFTGFDQIAIEYQCERIKTIGDAYLFCCGVPDANEKHALRIVSAAKEMVAFLENRNRASAQQWQVRAGVHSGELVAGLVGARKNLYDIFGDTVNIASRMEEHSLPMQVNISKATHTLLQDDFIFTKRSEIEVKGKGLVSMYFVEDIVVVEQ